MNPSRIRRNMIKSEVIWRKNCKRKRRKWKFRNTAPLHLPLTGFYLVFCLALCKFSLDVILVPLYIVVISLLLSTYICSVRLVISINLSVHQSIKKIGHEASSPLAGFVIFSPSPSFSFIFLVAKHPLLMINQGKFV